MCRALWFNLHNNPVRRTPLLAPFYRSRNCGTERLGGQEGHELVSNRTTTTTTSDPFPSSVPQAFFTLSPSSPHAPMLVISLLPFFLLWSAGLCQYSHQGAKWAAETATLPGHQAESASKKRCFPPPRSPMAMPAENTVFICPHLTANSLS